MVNIIMVFAQLELETTTKRITDNYFARARSGTFVGGTIAYGYETSREILNGKKIAVLKQNKDEIKIIKRIFDMYIQNISIRLIAKKISEEFDKLVTDKKVKRFLTNPIYVEADINIYNYYKSKGIQIINKIDEFDGKHGLIIYGKEKGKKNRIYQDIDKQLLVIGKHTPIIDSKTFLLVQEKLKNNKKNVYAKKQGKYTWLTGILKCADCGHSIGVKITRNYKYMMCSKYRLYNACINSETYKLKELEDTLYLNMKKHISEIDIDKLCSSEDVPRELLEQLNNLNMQRLKHNDEIENLVNAIATGTIISSILENKINIINSDIIELDKKIYELQSKINNYGKILDKDLYVKSIKMFLNDFSDLDVEEKNNVVKLFVKDIKLNSNVVDINYII